MNEKNVARHPNRAFLCWLWGLIPVTVLLALLFASSFKPGAALFSNDGPLGGMSADFGKMPGLFFGLWNDLYWVGGEQPSASPTFTSFLLYGLGPVGYAKWYAPLAVLFAAVGGAFFARRLGGKGGVMALVALAAALNSNYFSYDCWGLASRSLTLGALLLGISALWGPGQQQWLARTALAGFCVGIGLMESYDVGAIFSLYLAAFALFLTIIDSEKLGAGLGKAVVRVGLLAVCAAIMAAHTLGTLISTQVKGVAILDQKQETPQEKWDWATQWSLPKQETLRVLIPGLYGYRMDTGEGGNYWGRVGETPGWDKHHQGWPRYSGAGEYAGVLVLLVAAWAVAQALRRKNSVFPDRERKIILFWAGAAVVSLLLAWGRHAPFYQLIYPLPFFKTIRNPIKFTHPMHLSLIILFALGTVGLWRTHLEKAVASKGGLLLTFLQWWRTGAGFERRWLMGLFGLIGLSALGWLLFAASRAEVLRYLQASGFPENFAPMIFKFSLGEIGWYLLFLVLSVVWMGLVLSGALAGGRARWALVLGGLVLATDLVRANAPWVIYYDYKDRLASHPVLDILREKPYLQRVKGLPSQLQELYSVEWAQHQFPYYNIQTLDVTQEPRRSEENKAYRAALEGDVTRLARLWELTNTRYLIGQANMVDELNRQLDPQKRRFRIHTRFTLAAKRENPKASDYVSVLATNGPFAIIEFTGALPRAKLYSQWRVVTNGTESLKILADPAFEPAQTVLVDEPLAVQPAAGATNEAGTVDFVSYAPKHIQLRAKSSQGGVLLLNNKHHPDWKVWVDGQPAALLRCNFLMQGVYVPAGEHQVELRFAPAVTVWYVSLGAFGVAILLCAWLALAARKTETTK